MILTKKQKEEFEEKVRPLMEWLGKEFYPYVKVIVSYSDAEILEASALFKTDDYVQD